MANRSGFVGARRTRAPARQTVWIGPADQPQAAVASNTSVVVASFDASAAGFDKATLVRTRGVFLHRPSAYSVDLAYQGAFGIGIVSDDAFAIGTTAIPGPFTDSDWGGWFVWRSFGYFLENGSNIGLLRGHESLEIDSKAMRKIGPNETMVVMCESQAGAFSIWDGTRHLLKLA